MGVGGEEVPKSRALAIPRSGKVDADGFDDTDVRMPRLQIVNGNGAMSRIYNQGELVYADHIIFGTPQKDVHRLMRFVPLGLKKQFRSNLSEEEVAAGDQPQVFNSKEEILSFDSEATFEWVDNEKPRYSPTCRALLVIELPEGVEHPAFTYEAEGGLWAPAVYYAGGSAYSKFALPIHNGEKFACLEEVGGVKQIVHHAKIWTFEVLKSSGGKFTVFQPNVKLTPQRTVGELRELCERLIGHAAPEPDAGE